jgi:apolipoprotein D and lipocalin family protein
MRRLRPALLAALTIGCVDGGPAVATDVDLARLEGRWHEIARVPREHDERCHDTVADYRLLSPDKLELVHRCRMGSSTGPISAFRAVASRDDEREPAKLSMAIGLYRGAYWVLEVGREYEYLVIGHPSRTMAWILAREPELADGRYDEILGLLEREGFGTHLLKKTPRSLGAAAELPVPR